MSIHSGSPKQSLPSLDILGRAIVDSQRGTPLHLQVRQALREIIDDHFVDGQLFWPEKIVAERLGVSRGTVRQAIGELTREGLLLRHHARGSFVQKGTEQRLSLTTVSLFLSHYDSDFLKEMLPHIAAACRIHSLRLEVFDTHEGELTSKMYRQIERPPAEQGVILLLEPRATMALYTAFHDRGYRTVTIESPVPNFSGPSVGTDPAAALQIGMEYLLSLGHNRIVFLVNEPAEAISVQSKIATFESMKKEGILPEAVLIQCGITFWENSHQAAYRHMDEVWAHNPTAIYTASDPGAWAAMKWLYEHKIDVPGDVSVLGFEDVAPSRHLSPALSTVAHPMEQIALEAVEMLIEGRTGQVMLAPVLVVRESTGVVRVG